MGEAIWQQIGVWAMVLIAAIIAVYSGISAWRALKRGECGSCGGCSGTRREELADPAEKKERIVFLPADQLRVRTRMKRQ